MRSTTKENDINVSDQWALHPRACSVEAAMTMCVRVSNSSVWAGERTTSSAPRVCLWGEKRVTTWIKMGTELKCLSDRERLTVAADEEGRTHSPAFAILPECPDPLSKPAMPAASPTCQSLHRYPAAPLARSNICIFRKYRLRLRGMSQV